MSSLTEKTGFITQNYFNGQDFADSNCPIKMWSENLLLTTASSYTDDYLIALSPGKNV